MVDFKLLFILIAAVVLVVASLLVVPVIICIWLDLAAKRKKTPPSVGFDVVQKRE